MKKYFCTIATLVLVLNTTMGQSISRDKAASDLKNASKQAEGAAATSGTSAADTNARAAAQLTEKAKKKGAIQKGTVVGTLTINGEVIKLKYVYAQKRSALSPGDASLFSNGTDPKDVIAVIITNRPMSEETLTDLQEDRYHGDNKVKGINLIIDSGANEWQVSYLLLESGIVRPTLARKSRGNIKVDAGRVAGEIRYTSYDLDLAMCSVLFDAPLIPRDQAMNAMKRQSK